MAECTGDEGVAAAAERVGEQAYSMMRSGFS